MLEALGSIFIWAALLFVAWVIGASVWDAWALGERWQRRTRKRLEPGAAPVMELDFSAKRARREAERYAWARDFIEALGTDRDTFVSEWEPGSRRSVLAKRLREAEEQAVKDGRRVDAEEIHRMRIKVTGNPEQRIGDGILGMIEEHLKRIEGEAAYGEAYRMVSAGWRL